MTNSFCQNDSDVMLKILLPLIIELIMILCSFCVCCDIDFFFSVPEKLPSSYLIETSQSSEYCLKTFLIHENFASSVELIGISVGIRWSL